MKRISALFALFLLASAHTWAVPVTVSFDPVASTMVVGDTIDIDIVADIPDPVIAFGFDLAFDAALLNLTAALFEPAWTPVAPPGPPLSDGEGFGALLTPTFPPAPGLAGDGILLLTLTFEALAPGLSTLQLAATPGDLSEGFALATGGFAEVDFVPATIEILAVHEPATWALMLAGLLLLHGGLHGGGRMLRGVAT